MSSSDAESSEATLEIKIRALDSSSYSIRVNKDIPVPSLKERLQSLVGVPAQEQRLIYRGKVLKDDQLLSAYNVEDGHTLHLVPRPQQAQQAQAQQNPQVDAPLPSEGRVTTSLLVGTINVPTVGDGSLPDFNRIVSAVLGNIPGANIQGANAQASTNIPGAPEVQQGGQPRTAAQPAGVYQPLPRPIEVSTDALTTLSLYINRMEQMFLSTGLVAPLQAPPPPPLEAPRANRPMSPALLGNIILRALSLLSGQAAPILSGLAGQFENEASITDAVMRSEVQAAAVWNGTVLQQLGALLLELGRSTLTLSMGSSTDEAFVNAGPAVFISPSGPNPLMVQPMPFQPLGTLSPRLNGWPGVGLGGTSGPRSLNIHIHASDVGMSPAPGLAQEQAGGAPAAHQAPGSFQDGTAQAIVQETIMVFQDNGDARLLSSRSNPDGGDPQQQAQPAGEGGGGGGGAGGGGAQAGAEVATPQQMAQVTQALNQLWPGLGSLRSQQQQQQQEAGGNQGGAQQAGVVSMNLGPGTLASLLGQLAPVLQAAAMPNQGQPQPQPPSVAPQQQQQQQQQAPAPASTAQQPSVPSATPSVPSVTPHQASAPSPATTPAHSSETNPAAQASSSSEIKPKEEPKPKRAASSQTSAPAGLGSLRPLVPRRRQQEATGDSAPQRSERADEVHSGENILARLLGTHSAAGAAGGGAGGGELRRVLQQALPVVSQLLAGGLAQQTPPGDRNNPSEVNGASNNVTEKQSTGEALQKLEGDGSAQDVLRSVARAAMESSEVSLADSDVDEMLELSTDYLEQLLRDLDSRRR